MNGASLLIDSSELAGHALGHVNGSALHTAEVSTNATSSLSVPAHVNGHSKGHANGHTNGHANGHTNGHSNGHANGNGNGYANGHSNGHANGFIPGPARQAALMEVALSDVSRLAAMAVASPQPAFANGAPAHATNGSARPALVPVVPVLPEGAYAAFGKRVLDLLGASLALVFLAPIMGLAALILRFDSRGPMFYRSTRLGKNGKPFTFYKLRSMRVGADAERERLLHLNEADGPVFKLRCDPRVTRIGQFLRSSSIDELPQLFNVLKGDMSLVGPRPPLPDEAERYESWQRRRLDVKPGITCLWQISGRSRLSFEEWMRLDLEYIRRQSLVTDLWILVRTIPAVLSREGAY